jgi:inner membrane protein
VVGQVLLPIGLTLAVMAWARWRRPKGPHLVSDGPPLRAGWLLALSYLALYSHLLLDFLNNYGVRLLAPVEWRWFYGDAVFIVDPWLWVVLGAGVWVARRHGRPQPAALSLGIATGYVAVMLASAAISREAVVREWRAVRGYDPVALMVGPVPVSPFSHEVIIDAGDHYETGTYRFWSPRLRLDAIRVPKNEHLPEVRAARGAPAIRSLLVWSRFPVWQVQRTGEGARVTLQDMRFRGGARFSASTVVP